MALTPAQQAAIQRIEQLKAAVKKVQERKEVESRPELRLMSEVHEKTFGKPITIKKPVKKEESLEYVEAHADPEQAAELKQSTEKLLIPIPATASPFIQKNVQRMQEKYIQGRYERAYKSMTPTEKIEYVRRYGTFEGGKTWGELKRENPYLELQVKGTDVYAVDTRTQLDYHSMMEKQIEKQPPVLKELTWIGFGGLSMGTSLIGGIAGILGKKEEVDKFYAIDIYARTYGYLFPGVGPKISQVLERATKPYLEYGIHWPSPIDYALEPLGLSPKGSSEYMTRHPFYLIGGLAGEAATFYAFDKGMRAISTVGKIGIKGIVKRAPVVYGKFTQVFPEERLITGVGRGFSQTQFYKHLYGWGAKGWKVGKEFVQGPTVRTTSDGLTLSKTTYKKGSRIWMTTDDIARYNQKIAQSNILEIGFPSARIEVSGVGRITGVADITKYNRGLFGRTFSKTYGYSLLEKDAGVQLYPKSNIVFDYGTKVAGTKTFTKTSWYDEVARYMTQEFERGRPYQIVKNVWLAPEKKWHLLTLGKKELRSLWSNEATETLLKRPISPSTIFLTIPKTTKTFFGGMTIKIPVQTSGFLSAAAIGAGYLGSQAATGYLSEQQKEIVSLSKLRTFSLAGQTDITKQSQHSIENQINELTQTPALINLTVQAAIQTQLQAQDAIIAQDTIKTTLQKEMQKYITGGGTMQISRMGALATVGKLQEKERDYYNENQAYNVFVRERQYYDGRRLKQGSFIKANRQPLSRLDALAYGGYIVDNSEAASFKISRTGGKPNQLQHDISPWGSIQDKFYVKGNIIIEKTDFRIDTTGELQGITARGIIAAMNREVKQTKRIATKTKKPKYNHYQNEIENTINQLMNYF